MKLQQLVRIIFLLVILVLLSTSIASPVKAVTVSDFVCENIGMTPGISVVLYGNDTTMDINTPDFFDDLESRTLCVRSIIFTFPIYMDGWYATEVYEDAAQTPGVENIRIFIREAHSRGYTLWLKPLIDDSRLEGRWRGSIEPGGSLENTEALAQWFESYTALMSQYAELAQEEQILGLIIGTELNSIDKAEPAGKYTDHWTQLINTVREIYWGQLAYAMNWSPVVLPGFADQLDVLMIDAFYDLHGLTDEATVEEIYHAWLEWEPIIDSYRALGIPLMFAEVGVAPRKGSFHRPWAHDYSAPADYDAQARYYEATCHFIKNIGLDGNYWWAIGFYDYFENQMGRLTYGFYDVPAEQIVRECYGYVSLGG